MVFRNLESSNVFHCTTDNIMGCNWVKRVSVYRLSNLIWEGIEAMEWELLHSLLNYLGWVDGIISTLPSGVAKIKAYCIDYFILIKSWCLCVPGCTCAHTQALWCSKKKKNQN